MNIPPCSARTRVGFLGGYLDFDRDWSGVPLGISRGLEQLGVDTEYVDATPVRIGRPVYRWLSMIGRAGNGWQLSPEMVAAASVTGLIRRHRARPDVHGWIQLRCPPLGRPAPGRYVTFEDMTVAQILAQFQTGHLGQQFSDRRWSRWNSSQAELYRHAHACCTVSNWSKASLMADYGVPEEKIHVVGLGRNVDVVCSEQRDWSVPRYLFVGRDWRRKNGDAVVRAFRRLRDAIPAAHLDIVGHHPVVDEPGIQGHGHLSYGDEEEARRLRQIISTATCFVMPSLSEAFAIVYLEAASSGLPVIATTEGGIRDALGDDGALYVNPHDDDGLHDAMIRLADPALASSVGTAARRNAAPYTWERVARGVLGALFGDGEHVGTSRPTAATPSSTSAP